MADVLGKGWAFPFQFDANGKVLTTSDQPDGGTSDEGQKVHLNGALAQVVMTSFGERIMRPTFGSGLMDLVFEPNDESLAGLAMYLCTDAVRKWDRRVTPVNVESYQDEGRLVIRLVYRINRTQQLNAMVIPFGGE